MTTKMYLWYLQKPGGHSSYPSPLPEAIGAILTMTKGANNLLVSPGFLSATHNTTDSFIDSLASATNGFRNHYSIGFLRGMGKRDYFKRLSCHEQIINSATCPLSYGPVFYLKNASEDHRKMIFIYSYRNKNLAPTIYYPRMPLTLDDAKQWLLHIQVNAIVIGSSNFSYATYFNTNGSSRERGESDLILMAHNSNNPSSNFSNIIEGFSSSASTHNYLQEQFSESVFAEGVFYGADDNPQAYLNDILLKTLESHVDNVSTNL